MWKLWTLLLSKAANFDEASDELHVEDVLISKRVVVSDEWYWVAESLQQWYDAEQELESRRDTEQFARHDRKVNAHLKSVSEINRFRRNKLLLTHWSGSRPW